jgi:hypothetical protein
MNRFTVLTSLFNSEQFIDQYFDTIFSQKILPTEIVLIDDTNNPKDLDEILNKKKILYKIKKIILIKII